MAFKIEIPNLPGVTRSISKIPGALGDNFRSASAQARRLLTAELIKYPPPPANSGYVRTERLLRGWQHSTPIAGGKGFQMINSILYAQWVQGDQQAKVHRGRWKPASQIAKELEPTIVDLFGSAVEKALDQ